MTDIDRTGWGHGPWDNEPDKLVWVDPYTNLDCMIHRNRMGALCGYVGVPEGHPAFEKHYDDVNVHVHGGLTYADSCRGDLCHEAQPGRPAHVWWLGFDCNHLGDFAPRSNRFVGHPTLGEFYPRPYDHADALSGTKKADSSDIHAGDIYRDVAYVRNEVTNLAAQLYQLDGVLTDLVPRSEI
jgi:hypothetical protein